jgi:hypothetical protein
VVRTNTLGNISNNSQFMSAQSSLKNSANMMNEKSSSPLYKITGEALQRLKESINTNPMISRPASTLKLCSKYKLPTPIAKIN